MAMRKKAAESSEIVDVQAPNYRVLEITVIGTAPFYYNKWPHTSFDDMRRNMAEGTTSKARAKAEGRKGKDFQAQFQETIHRSVEGWHGIPATAFQQAIVRAASDVKPALEMSQLKRCMSVLPDGFADDGYPLVRVHDREPEYTERPTRNKDGGANIVAAGRLSPGWRIVLRIEFDADKYTPKTIANLVLRAGKGVGVGAGRPASKTSVGMGWGTFAPAVESMQAAAE